MIDLILLICLVLAAFWAVVAARMLKAVVGLALTSVIVSILMFRMNSPLAAVFELSVCAGLIPVIFITTISFTKRLSWEAYLERKKEIFSRFWYLPVILVITVVLLSRYKIAADFILPQAPAVTDVRHVLWNLRQSDLFGQIIILLIGAFGVVTLFKVKQPKDKPK
ncbi:MAG: hypothetical protein NTV07_06825 [Candidatus Omnitrophica bacterium]|nr:hypothetical protein [Candidatus Omnitrophota bacterium]